MHLGSIAAVPFVALDRAGEPPADIRRRFKEGLAKIGPGAPERDPFEALAVVARRDAANVAVADDAGAQEADRAGGDMGLRPSGSIRARGVECVTERSRDSAGREQSIEENGAVAARF